MPDGKTNRREFAGSSLRLAPLRLTAAADGLASSI
jgi:hypothetical protein